MCGNSLKLSPNSPLFTWSYVIEAYRKKRNFSISSGNSLPMPFAVIARSGATWQSHCYNRACPSATSLVNFTIAVVFVELKYDNLSIASQVWARDCFALLAMTEPEFIEKLQKKGYQSSGTLFYIIEIFIFSRTYLLYFATKPLRTFTAFFPGRPFFSIFD